MSDAAAEFAEIVDNRLAHVQAEVVITDARGREWFYTVTETASPGGSVLQEDDRSLVVTWIRKSPDGVVGGGDDRGDRVVSGGKLRHLGDWYDRARYAAAFAHRHREDLADGPSGLAVDRVAGSREAVATVRMTGGVE